MNTQHVNLFAETLPVTFMDSGSGRPYLLLHGGAGPRSMAGLADALAPTGQAILPTHPGFDGASRSDWFRRIDDLVTAYLALLERLDLNNVVVIGNSVGGWLAAELSLRASPRVAALVLLNAVGLDPTPASGPIVDPISLAPAERGSYSFHDPARFAIMPTGPEGMAIMAANQQTLRVYAGEPFMHDPRLRTRLLDLRLPTLVLWGASDRIVTTAYGQQFADLIAGAQFTILPKAGHFPQIEQPESVVTHVGNFLLSL